MSSHLTLVVDNSDEQRATSRASRTPRTHWVHRSWVPRRRRGAMRRHPSFGDALREQLADDSGAVTAEYAVVIIAGIAFAGLLVAIIRSDEIRQMLVGLVQNALGSAG